MSPSAPTRRCARETARAPGCIWKASSGSWRARSRIISTEARSEAGSGQGYGLLFLGVTALGWGLNWPVLKALLGEMPPLAARGGAGLLAGCALAAFAALRGVPLAVPAGRWGPLIMASLLNVTAWMGLATMGLLYLGAGEGAMICYTMPAWTALAAWPVLGERPTFRRILALFLGMGGVAILVTSNGFDLDWGKMPGVLMILGGAVLFALGTVWFKRHPVGLNPLASVAWQVGLGCLPLAIASPFLEYFDPAGVSPQGWAAFIYMAAVPLCLCYLAWFAALAALPASVAAIGTLFTPVIGVISGALLLGELLGGRQLAALVLTLSGIVLAIRGEPRREEG
ncbi:DMT family transporter [Roseomonas sp. SSH11]|uniref:DMT family transporter n=1 Tax=Pararoseomonas baculiformis TaxID=2820812 RepID=A0ABS4AIA3_9PROT|nr:DMT family transporter [Pararoseomonas baculiformis]MBP0445959.1 DMT family transporter [Pararoseomonas baculiformis]